MRWNSLFTSKGEPTTSCITCACLHGIAVCTLCVCLHYAHVRPCYPCRYTKGTQERGHVLGAVDDIVLSLDDNAMNLQSMAASRFVGPFLDKVQKWEKSLSHISEVVEV